VNRNDFIVQIGDVLRVDDDCRTKMTPSQPDDQVGSAGKQVRLGAGIDERGNRLIEGCRTQVGKRTQGDGLRSRAQSGTPWTDRSTASSCNSASSRSGCASCLSRGIWMRPNIELNFLRTSCAGYFPLRTN